jgi:uncharacterized protein (TIGR03000 family)
MTKRWFAAVGVGTLALLLGSAGTSRAQFFFSPGYTWNNSSSYSYGVGRPYFGSLAAAPSLFGTPSSLAVTPVSYVAYYPPLYSGSAPAVAPASALLPADQPATVEVTAPADAEILFDGQRTSQTGTQRTFTTPPLEKGPSYHYDVTARWRGGPADGQTQRVQVYAGAHVSVVFPRPK